MTWYHLPCTYQPEALPLFYSRAHLHHPIYSLHESVSDGMAVPTLHQAGY